MSSVESLGAKAFPFGKFKGRTFREIYDTEKGYVNWAKKQELPSGGLRDFISYCDLRKANGPNAPGGPNNPNGPGAGPGLGSGNTNGGGVGAGGGANNNTSFSLEDLELARNLVISKLWTDADIVKRPEQFGPVETLRFNRSVATLPFEYINEEISNLDDDNEDSSSPSLEERWYARISTKLVGSNHAEGDFGDFEQVQFQGKEVKNSRGEHIGWIAKEINDYFKEIGICENVRLEGTLKTSDSDKKYPTVSIQVFATPKNITAMANNNRSPRNYSPRSSQSTAATGGANSSSEDSILNAMLNHNLIGIAKQRCQYSAVHICYVPKGIAISELTKREWRKHFPTVKEIPSFIREDEPQRTNSLSSNRVSDSHIRSELDQQAQQADDIIEEGVGNSDAAKDRQSVMTQELEIEPTKVLSKLYEYSAQGYESMAEVDRDILNPNAVQETISAKAPKSKAMKKTGSSTYENKLSLLSGTNEPYHLLPHQAKAVFWMLNREKKTSLDTPRGSSSSSYSSSSSGTQNKMNVEKIMGRFWERVSDGRHGTKWRHRLTGSKYDTPPHMPRGGILADEMGLGKTISCISLIAAADLLNLDSGPDLFDSADYTSSSTVLETLVVCPVVMMRVWEEALERGLQYWLHPKKTGEAPRVRINVFHGANKSQAGAGQLTSVSSSTQHRVPLQQNERLTPASQHRVPPNSSSHFQTVVITITSYHTLMHNKAKLLTNKKYHRAEYDL